MSLLVFSMDDQGITVLTDTLLTDNDGVPVGHIDKATTFPRLRMAMAITGHVSLASRWGYLLRSHGLHQARDIVDVDAGTPRLLGDVHRQLMTEIPAKSAENTSTVYHFGWDTNAGRWVIYVYRSTTGFVSERIDVPCFAAKPHPAGGIEDLDGTVPTLGGLIGLAEAIRDTQNEKPFEERVHIGGQLVMTQLMATTVGPGVLSVPVHDLDRPRTEPSRPGE